MATALTPRVSASGRKRTFLRGSSGSVPELPADAHVAAGGAVVAAVLADEGVVAALGAGAAGEHRRRLGGGCLEDAHFGAREAFLVEHAEHRIAVHDEPGEVRHRRRIGLLLAAAGHEG